MCLDAPELRRLVAPLERAKDHARTAARTKAATDLRELRSSIWAELKGQSQGLTGQAPPAASLRGHGWSFADTASLPPETIHQLNKLVIVETLLIKIRRRRSWHTLQACINDSSRLLQPDRLIAHLETKDWFAMSDGLRARSQRRLLETWKQLRRMWCQLSGLAAAPGAWGEIKPSTAVEPVFVPQRQDIIAIIQRLAGPSAARL